MVTYLLARRLGASPVAAFGGVLLLATTPVVLHSSATITSDAPSLLVGGLLCLTAMLVADRRVSVWWLAPAATLCTARSR